MTFGCRLLGLLTGRIAGLSGLPGARAEEPRRGETGATHAGRAVGLTGFRTFNLGKQQQNQRLARGSVVATGTLRFDGNRSGRR